LVRDRSELGRSRVGVVRPGVSAGVGHELGVARWTRFGLVKITFATVYRGIKYPSTQTRIAVGQVVVLRSTLRAFQGTSKIVRNARVIGTWVLGYFGRGKLVGKGVLTRKIGSPSLVKPDALVSHRVLQTGDVHSLRSDLEGPKQVSK